MSDTEYLELKCDVCGKIYKKLTMEEYAIEWEAEQPLKHPERKYVCVKCFNKDLIKLLKEYPIPKERMNKIKKLMKLEEQREEEELLKKRLEQKEKREK